MTTLKTKRSRRAQKTNIAEFYPYRRARDLNVAKRHAALAVKHALRIGALSKAPCEECGAKAEGHHDDYSKPLEVRWLCRFHHRRRDADLRDIRRAEQKDAERAALPMAYLKRQARLQSVPFAFATKGSNRRRSNVAKDCTIALVVQATLAVSDVMDAEDISEAVLSRRMKVSRQMVNTQFAGGFRSLKILAAYADALGYDARFTLHKRESAAVAS